jgi:hypothetical protein
VRALRIAAIGLCVLVALGAGVARATGGGGGTIASAPVVTAGVQQIGSTASFTDSCQNGYEFWALQLKQGDLVKLTWGSPGAVDTVALWPKGTTDSSHTDGCLYAAGWSHWTPTPLVSGTNTTPGTTTVTQTLVPSDGTYPLLFLDTTGVVNAGAYSFTADVLHAASVTLPHISAVPTNGKLTVAVAAPDTAPIGDSGLKLTLVGIWGKRSHKLATATPASGSATFAYAVPASGWGKKIQLAVTGAGTNYQPVASLKEPVKVKLPPAGPVIASTADLKSVSKLLRQPIYWAGPRKGYREELSVTANRYSYVRYLRPGVDPGATGSSYLIVATYPFADAYAGLKKFAQGKAVKGPNGCIYFAKGTSVYVAFPGLDYEIEVYDPSAKIARAIVTGGALRAVR